MRASKRCAALDDALDDTQVGRGRELLELAHRRFGVGPAAGRDVDQDRATAFRSALRPRQVAVELLLERLDQREEVLGYLPRRARRKEPVALPVGRDILGPVARGPSIEPPGPRTDEPARNDRWSRLAGSAAGGIGRRQQVRDADGTRPAVGFDGDERQRVEPVQGERREVVARRLLVRELGRHEAQRAEPQAPGGCARLARHFEPVRFADGDGVDAPRAIDEQPHAAVQSVADLRDLARQVVAQHEVRRDPAPEQLLELVTLGGLQSQEIALDGGNRRAPRVAR